MKVVCINAKNKPEEIPTNLWLERDEMYTVLKVQKMAKQNNLMSFVLEEIKLPAEHKYDSFISNRFRPATEDDMDAIAAVEKLLEEVEVGDFIYV